MMLSLLMALWVGVGSAMADERGFLDDLAQVRQALSLAWAQAKDQTGIRPETTLTQLASFFPSDWRHVVVDHLNQPAIDDIPGQGAVSCTEGQCYQVPSGGMVFFDPIRSLAGVTRDHALFVLFDPDGRWTGNIVDEPDRGHYKAIRIFVTATGETWREDQWRMNLMTSRGRYSVNPGNVPAWAHPEYWAYQERWAEEIRKTLNRSD